MDRPTRERKQVQQFKPEVKEKEEFVIKPGRLPYTNVWEVGLAH
jgi:hypothetical protein